MSDAQLALLLDLIYTQLNSAIDKIEQALPEGFKVTTGGSNILLDPIRVDVPILEDLYNLRHDLATGIDDLRGTKTRRNNT